MSIHKYSILGDWNDFKCPIPTETAMTVMLNQLKSDENAGIGAYAPAEVTIGSFITSGSQNFHFIIYSKRQTFQYYGAL